MHLYKKLTLIEMGSSGEGSPIFYTCDSVSGRILILISHRPIAVTCINKFATLTHDNFLDIFNKSPSTTWPFRKARSMQSNHYFMIMHTINCLAHIIFLSLIH